MRTAVWLVGVFGLGLLVGGGVFHSEAQTVTLPESMVTRPEARTLYLGANTNVNINRNGNFSVPFEFERTTGVGTADSTKELLTDVNGDGLTDIANYNYPQVMLNLGDGTWQASIADRIFTQTPAAGTQTHVVDIDADGKVEEVSTYWEKWNDIYFLHFDDRRYPVTHARLQTNALISFKQGVHLLDVNSDNLPDIVVSGKLTDVDKNQDTIYKAIWLNKDGGVTWEKVFEQSAKG